MPMPSIHKGHSEVESLLQSRGYWDDLRVNANAVATIGSNPPTFKKLFDDGATGSGYALEFDGDNDEYVEIPSSASLNFDSNASATTFSIGFLIRIDTPIDTGHVITKDGNDWRIDLRNNGYLRVRTNSGISYTTDNPLDIGSVNSVVVTFDCSTSEVVSECYINGQLAGGDTDNDPLDDSTDVIYINSRNGSASMATFEMDELRIWDSVLSASEIAAFHNGGAFTETGIATEICGYHFNEGSGTDCDNFEGTAALDIDMTTTGDDPAWIAGFISGASRGVYGYVFDADILQEVHFAVQLPHGYKYGTSLYPHVHWTPLENGGSGEYPRWGLEYTFAEIGEGFGNTATIYGESPAPSAASVVSGTHYLTNLTPISGTGVDSVSAMLICRLFRDATNAGDDFAGEVGFTEFDFHIIFDAPGSREEVVK